MNFDPTPFDFVWALAAWVFLFGTVAALVILLTVIFSPLVHGANGPRRVLRYLYPGRGPRTGALVGAVLGAAGGALLFLLYREPLLASATAATSLTIDDVLAEVSTPALAALSAVLYGLFGAILGGPLVTALGMSGRRVWALTVLTWRESIRKKVLLVFVVFALLFMFAGWFMPSQEIMPELEVKNHVSFVLRTITWLVLPVVLLLACWGLPEDIKSRSLHTVVTKPARKNEIVLGRMLGFTLVGTAILAAMAAAGYMWILRGVSDEARRHLVARVPVYGQLVFLDRQGRRKEKGINVGYIDDFRSYIAGATQERAVWTFEDLDPSDFGENLIVETNFEAFRTHKGKIDRSVLFELRFAKDLRDQAARNITAVSLEQFESVRRRIQEGKFGEAGDELRQLGDAVVNQQIRPNRSHRNDMAAGFEDLVELLEPFRRSRGDEAWVGEMIQAARGVGEAARDGDETQLGETLSRFGRVMREHAAALENNLVNMVFSPVPQGIVVEEFKGRAIPVKREITYQVGDEDRTGDLFADLAHGGKLQAQVLCLDSGQYLGMARPDLFLRKADRPFAVGFVKSIVGIWLMMVLVIVVGVTASTFVKGPVATILTFVILIVGSDPTYGFLTKLAAGQVTGGGTTESFYRLVQHMNPQLEIGDIAGRSVMEGYDAFSRGILWSVHKLVPDFTLYRMSPYVANGFDVPWNAALAPSLAMTLVYLIPCLLIGFFALRLRELEAK